MKSTHKIVALLTGVVLLVTLVVMASFWAFQQTKVAAELRKHTYDTIIHAKPLLAVLKDAETGQHGYLLTDDETFLAPYLAVRDNIGSPLETLRQFSLSADAHQHLGARLVAATAQSDSSG